jgi:hypothetical protein
MRISGTVLPTPVDVSAAKELGEIDNGRDDDLDPGKAAFDRPRAGVDGIHHPRGRRQYPRGHARSFHPGHRGTGRDQDRADVEFRRS